MKLLLLSKVQSTIQSTKDKETLTQVLGCLWNYWNFDRKWSLIDRRSSKPRSKFGALFRIIKASIESEVRSTEIQQALDQSFKLPLNIVQPRPKFKFGRSKCQPKFELLILSSINQDSTIEIDLERLVQGIKCWNGYILNWAYKYNPWVC